MNNFEDYSGLYPRDIRDPKGAWAPGTYSNKCCACGSLFLGDKRAVMCADCAYDEEAKKKKRSS